MLVGLEKVAGSLIISKMQEKLVNKTQANQSYLGKIVRKVINKRETKKFSVKEFKQLLIEIYQETPELKVEIDDQQLAKIIDESIKQSLEQLAFYENNQNYQQLQEWLTEELGYLQEEMTADIQKELQELQKQFIEEITLLRKQRQKVITRLVNDGKNTTRINESRLKKQNQLILQELHCPKCGGYPLTKKRSSYQCPYCDSVFKEDDYFSEQEIKKLTFEKLQRLSALQLGYATMSSRNDRPYDPDKFIIRKDLQTAFESFQHNELKKAFLLLGEAGFGKTWSASHEAFRLIDQQYPVFYVALREGIEQFFKATFDASLQKTLNKISKIAKEIPRPIVWILDGYDEVRDNQERRTILIDFIQWIERTDNQSVIITSRSYDWYNCSIANDDDLNTSLLKILWTNKNDSYSFLLKKYTEKEIIQVLPRYNLPPIEEWPPLIAELAKYPLWIRLLAEWYIDNDNQLPQEPTVLLFKKYFARMNIKLRYTKTLSDICYKILSTHNNLESTIDVTSEEIDTKAIDMLNSAGIIFYDETELNASLRLANPLFGCFGLSFKGKLLLQSNNRADYNRY